MAFDRAASPLRWLVLVLACLSMLGSYYCYDNPSVLNDQFESFYDIDSVQFNLLYTVYSIPNIVLPFFGGYFVDRLGTKVTLFTFLTLITIGQCVFALSASTHSFPLALVGRVIFGFGGESLSVGQSTLLALWFRGREMAMAMGINLSFSRLGSVINNNVTPAAYDYWSLPVALWIGFFICILSLVSGLTLIFVERYAEAQAQSAAASSSSSDEERQRLTNPVTSPDMGGKDDGSNNSNNSNDNNGSSDGIRFSDIKEFPVSFWLIALSCVVVYSAILPFNSNASSFLESDKYDFSESAAGRIQSIPFLISACASPFLGGVVDKLGYRTYLTTGAAAGLTLAHVLMAFTDVNPALPFAILGCSYSVYAAALWPSVAFVVKAQYLGTAYGIVTAVQNGGLAAVPPIVGAISTDNKYIWREIFFSCVALFGVLIGFFLVLVDRNSGGVLNMPSEQAAKVAEARYNNPSLNGTDSSVAQPLLRDGRDNTNYQATQFVSDEEGRR